MNILVLTLFFRFGRRIPNFVCMIVGGVFCLIVLAVPASKCWYNYRVAGGEGGEVFQRFPPPLNGLGEERTDTSYYLNRAVLYISTCGLSLLLVLSLAPRGFSVGTPVFPLP